MSDVIFEEDTTIKKVSSPNHVPESALTALMMRYSAGILKTPTQARVAQIGIVIVCVFIFVLLNLMTGREPIKAPTDDLINSPQPTKPLR